MTTVPPAKATAPPDVAHAARDRLVDVHPEREPVAMAGDDEERVVDPDAEADHRPQRRRDVRDVGHVAEQADRARAR